MLDLAAAIDNSFLHAQAAPAYVAVEVAHSESNGEAEFVRNMEKGLKKHQDELEAWMMKGIEGLKVLENHLAKSPFRLDEGQVARFIRLSDAIRERAERSAVSYAHLVKRLKKQSRAFAKYSASASDFMVSLALRVEASLDAELEFLLDVSDNYRALARQYDAKQKRSETFSDPSEVIAYLRSA